MSVIINPGSGPVADGSREAARQNMDTFLRDAPRESRTGSPSQRQDSLDDQLRDVRRAAVKLGCYDAADWIRSRTL